jgi:hypothetical protein
MMPAAALAYALSGQVHRDALNRHRDRPERVSQHRTAVRRKRG